MSTYAIISQTADGAGTITMHDDPDYIASCFALLETMVELGLPGAPRHAMVVRVLREAHAADDES